MKEAVKDADLVIESMAEIKDEKIKFYQTLAPLLEEKTIIVTNSSTLLPSMFAKYTGRAEKYLSLHFANTIWIKNTAEVMAHDRTDKKYFDANPQFSDAYAKEFEILIKIADAIEPKSKYFAVVCDGASDCFYKIKNPARPISASFDLARVSEYKTSGYGFIQQTDPLYAAIKYGLRKDKTYFIPSYLVTKTKDAIEAAKGH